MSNWEQWGASPEDLTGTETLPINKAGVSKYTTINKILAFIGAAYEAAGSIATAIAAHLAAYAHADIVHDNRAELDLVSGENTGDQDIAAWLASNKPGLNALESANVATAWTPSDISGAGLTLTPVNCKYVKIGKLIHLMGQITYPTTADATAAKIGGLPYNPIALQAATSFNTTGLSTFSTTAVIPGSALQFYNSFGAGIPRGNATLSGNTAYINISYICE
jgi:hypothetical protein